MITIHKASFVSGPSQRRPRKQQQHRSSLSICTKHTPARCHTNELKKTGIANTKHHNAAQCTTKHPQCTKQRKHYKVRSRPIGPSWGGDCKVTCQCRPPPSPPRGPGLWSMPPAITAHPAFKTLMTAQIQTFLHADPVPTTFSSKMGPAQGAHSSCCMKLSLHHPAYSTAQGASHTTSCRAYFCIVLRPFSNVQVCASMLQESSKC